MFHGVLRWFYCVERCLAVALECSIVFGGSFSVFSVVFHVGFNVFDMLLEFYRAFISCA